MNKLRQIVVLAWPTIAISCFFVVPFFLLLTVSVAHRDEGALWGAGFELTQYIALFDSVVIDTLVFSAGLAVLVALISGAVAFPFTYFITRMHRRAQIAWLILLLSTLSLSEVLIAFSWQVMLAKRVGLSNVLVWLGLLAEPESLSPNFGAVLCCLVYLVVPFTVLLLYPALSRLDRDLTEAARTLGATPLRVFFTVVLPMMRGPLISSSIVATIFTLGAYVAPSVLGRPEHWTIAILIGKAALTGGNLPFAAAMAVLLLVATLGLTGLTTLLGKREQVQS